MTYSVLLDSKGYYTGTYSDRYQLNGGTIVYSLPNSGDPIKDLCYQYINYDWRLDATLWSKKEAEIAAAKKKAAEREEYLMSISNEKLAQQNTDTMLALAESYENLTKLAATMETQQTTMELAMAELYEIATMK